MACPDAYSLPGNDALEMAVRRTYAVGRHRLIAGHFGDWDLDIPRLYGNFATSYGWVGVGNSIARCTEFGAPHAAYNGTMTESWPSYLYWSGNFLSAPGANGQALLKRDASNTLAPTDGNNYPLVTASGWQIRCLPALANGTGEGFLALSPDGRQYRFDWMARRRIPSMLKGSTGLARSEFWLMPTEVRDRFGNRISYFYNAAQPWQIERIEASDGRTLNFSYIEISSYYGSRIRTVDDGTRTWTYDYDSMGRLKSVLQPDGSTWQFNLENLTPHGWPLAAGADCRFVGDYPTLDFSGSMTHPSGATGTFVTRFIAHARSDAPQHCVRLIDSNETSGTEGGTDFSIYPSEWYTQALVAKRITGTGLAKEQQWSFAWPEGEPSGVYGAKLVKVTAPDGVITRYAYGVRFGIDEGQQLQIQEGWDGSQALRTTTLRYREPLGMPYPEPIGNSGVLAGDPLSMRHRPLDRKQITQQSVNFTWEAMRFDAHTRVTELNRSGPAGTRTDATEYFVGPAKFISRMHAADKSDARWPAHSPASATH